MYLIAFLCFSFAFTAGQISESSAVLELTDTTFGQATGQYENLFVEFYTPWCGHCRSITPEYEKAAEAMRNEGFNIQFAKVNGDNFPGLRDEYGVTGYPTFKFFLASKNKILDFKDGRHSIDFVNYVKKKVASPVYEVTSTEDADSIIQHNDLIYFGFFKDPSSASANIFKDFAFDNDKSIYVMVHDPTISQHLNVQFDAVVVYKKWDQEKVVMEGDITYENIKNFHANHLLPLVSEFLEEKAVEIFSTGVKNYAVLFVDKDSDRFDSIYNNAKEVAQEFLGRVVFLYVNIKEEENEKVLEFFGIPLSKCPAIRFINMTTEDAIKYNPSFPDLDTQTIRSFVQGVMQGTVQPFYKSEEVPSNWDQAVKVLVGSTFDAFISNNNNNVIVYFYVPWCGHCKKLSPVWDELGLKFKDSDKVTVAKIDCSVNEVASFRVDQFPTIKLFLKQTQEVVEFTGDRTLEALVEFVESDGKIVKQPEASPSQQATRDEL